MKEKKKTLIISAIALVLVIGSILLFGWIGIWYCAIIAAIVGISLTGFKKHGLLKILSIMMLLIVILSNLLPGRQEIIDRIGIADLLDNYFSIVLQNFSPVVLFILAVGGFYGVLNKTPAYKKLLDNIVTTVKPLNKKFIYIIIILFAVIASLTGMTIPLFIFVPFVVSIILLLGYDKLVALTSTIGSIIIGYMGGIFVNFVNPNTYSINTYEEFIGIENKLANTFPKLLLLFSGITLLIYFISKHIKSVEEKKVNYELTDSSELLVTEVKGSYKELRTWPLIVVFALIFVIITLGMIPWNSLFNITVFKDFHEWLVGIQINKIPVIPSIISPNLPALGEWSLTKNLMASYSYLSMLLVFMTLIIALINKVKANEMLDNYYEGVKKLLPAAFLITVAYTILVCTYNNGFLELIISNFGKFNYGLCALFALLGAILNVDTTWILISAFAPIINLIADESIYESVAILLQGIYGIFMFVGPTSLILIIGLSYLDIPYTTWMKYIWRFILALIILLALVTLLVVVL